MLWCLIILLLATEPDAVAFPRLIEHQHWTTCSYNHKATITKPLHIVQIYRSKLTFIYQIESCHKILSILLKCYIRESQIHGYLLRIQTPNRTIMALNRITKLQKYQIALHLKKTICDFVDFSCKNMKIQRLK